MSLKIVGGSSISELLPSSGEVESHASLKVAEGTLQALKWIALVAMAVDHTNKYAFREHLPFIFEIARSVLPIFAFVLAYNLARPGARASGVYGRTITRLAIAGLLSVPIASVLNAPLVTKWPWWPLNVLFMFLIAIAVPVLWNKGGAGWRLLAGLIFVIGGALVEYFWFGIFCCWTSFMFCRRPNSVRFSVWALSVLLLTLVNGNLWALASIPILLLAPKISLVLPRSKWAFYVFYPAHLLVIWVVCGVIGLQGAVAH